MTDYTITFARSARKELEALSVAAIDKILPKIEALSRRPRPSNCAKLRGRSNLWRIRVGVYRVVYAIDDARKYIDIIVVRHRRDAYK